MNRAQAFVINRAVREFELFIASRIALLALLGRKLP